MFSKLFTFKVGYFFAALILFAIEVIIALFIKDDFVRPYVGDVLVVILLYCMIKSIFNTRLWPTALAVLAFSFVVEALQYFNFVKLIGLGKSTLANIVLGNYFAWEDLLAYTIGIILVLIYESFRKPSARGEHDNPTESIQK